MHAPVMPPAPRWPEAIPVESTDGVTLAAYRSEETAARNTSDREVFLAHANGFCAAVFAPLLDSLGDTAWTAYDARAHGRSTRAGADMSWEGHRDDALHVIDACGVKRPVGVGHSMGGAALLLAEQARPGTFAALWLFEPIVFPDGIDEPADNPLEAGALRRRDSFPSREEAFANFASKAPLDELCSEALAAYVTHGFIDTPDGIALACRPEDEAAGYRMGVRHSAWAHLGEVRCPVVVTRGRSLGADPAAIAPLIAEGLPGGHLEDHPELGHFGPLAEPGTMAGSIRRLVEGLGA